MEATTNEDCEVSALVSRLVHSSDIRSELSVSMRIVDLLKSIHQLQDHVDVLSRGLQSPEASLTVLLMSLNTDFMTLHRVYCRETLHSHDQVIYEDVPYFDGNIRWEDEECLHGDRPIFNVESYLTQNPTLEFVVIKEYECQSTDRVRSHRVIWVLSPELRKLLSQGFQPDFVGSQALAQSTQELVAPYSEVYHNRVCLADLANNQVGKSALNSLLDLVLHDHAAVCEEAERMFSSGFVSGKHIRILYRPGQIILGHNEEFGLTRAGVLTKCLPSMDGSLELHGWCWVQDGSRLHKAPWTARISIRSEESIRINDLVVFPLEYAEPDLALGLWQRGEKFLKLDNPTCMAYTGWDAPRKRVIVSLSSHYLLTLLRDQAPTRIMIDSRGCKEMHEQGGNQVIEHRCNSIGPFKLETGGIKSQEATQAQWIEISQYKDVCGDGESYALLPPALLGFCLNDKVLGMYTTVPGLHPWRQGTKRLSSTSKPR
jgi:hypothetical protein